MLCRNLPSASSLSSHDHQAFLVDEHSMRPIERGYAPHVGRIDLDTLAVFHLARCLAHAAPLYLTDRLLESTTTSPSQAFPRPFSRPVQRLR
jgi:hypothetical protein